VQTLELGSPTTFENEYVNDIIEASTKIPIFEEKESNLQTAWSASEYMMWFLFMKGYCRDIFREAI
jgi:hypothetical protein